MAEPELIIELDNDMALFWVAPEDVREQDVNARMMTPEMQRRLTENIRREGKLESVPLAKQTEDGLEMISGHHRLRAAKGAGLERVLVLAYTRPMSRSETVAKQLAHNSLSGQDDPQTLERLFAELDEVEWQLESGLDAEEWGGGDQPDFDFSTPSLEFDWRYWGLAFLPSQMDEFEEVCDAIEAGTEVVGVVDRGVFEDFRATCRRLGAVEDVRSLDAIIARMIAIAKEHIKAEEEKQ